MHIVSLEPTSGRYRPLSKGLDVWTRKYGRRHEISLDSNPALNGAIEKLSS